MNVVKWVLLVGAAGYVIFVASLFVAQRSFLYHPRSQPISPAGAGLPSAEAAVVETSDHEKVIVWHVRPQAGKSVVIYFHGNAEVVASRVARHRQTIADGAGLIALSYRGYMGSTGTPTEDGLLSDAEAAYQFAVARYPADRIVLWGHSLGTGVAVALASERPVAKVILEAPFTSTADVAAGLFPFVPVRWLMRDQFRSDLRIAAVQAPLLIMHGERDRVVPFALGNGCSHSPTSRNGSWAIRTADTTISIGLEPARRRDALSANRRRSGRASA
jgi:pimeloyl-ACP methyl ester carboxylesterase